MRYLLSLILVIGLSSVSYGSGKIECVVTANDLLDLQREVQYYSGFEDGISVGDRIVINYDDNNLSFETQNSLKESQIFPELEIFIMQTLREFVTYSKFWSHSNSYNISVFNALFKIYVSERLLTFNAGASELDLFKLDNNKWSGYLITKRDINDYPSVQITSLYCDQYGPGLKHLIQTYENLQSNRD